MIRRTRPTAPARAGFTLIELMVVMLVTVILMSIIVAATSIGGQIVGESRSKGRIMDQQRVAMTALVRDLQLPHFLEDGKPNGRQRLSDHRTDLAREYTVPKMAPATGVDRKWTGYTPPRGGYFRAYSPPVDNNFNFAEGTDSDLFGSSRSGNHYVQFTVIVPGGAPQDTLTADVPFLNSPATASYPITFQAAEVAYFLVPGTPAQTPGGVKLYSLIRRQRCAAMNKYDADAYSALVNKIPTSGTAPVMAKDDPLEVVAAVDDTPTAASAKYRVFSMSDLTLEGNRVARAAITAHRIGDDVLLTNVISFELKYTGASTVGWPRPFGTANTDYPYDTLPYTGNVFDTFNTLQPDWTDGRYLAGSTTATAISPVCPIRITGVRIRLRCWDPRTKGARQTTQEVSL